MIRNIRTPNWLYVIIMLSDFCQYVVIFYHRYNIHQYILKFITLLLVLTYKVLQ